MATPITCIQELWDYDFYHLAMQIAALVNNELDMPLLTEWAVEEWLTDYVAGISEVDPIDEAEVRY